MWKTSALSSSPPRFSLVTTRRHSSHRPGPDYRPLAATIRLSPAVLRRWLEFAQPEMATQPASVPGWTAEGYPDGPAPPFSRLISVRFDRRPAAQATVGEAALTPSKPLEVPPGRPLLTCAQADPFHLSTSAPNVSLPLAQPEMQ